MNDHIPFFAGLDTDRELHLLSAGQLRRMSNLRSMGGRAVVRRGFVPVLHFADKGADFEYLWPVCLSFIPVRSMKFTPGDAALPQMVFSGFIEERRKSFAPATYPARRDALKEFYNGQGGFADAEVVDSSDDTSNHADKYTWETEHHRYE